MIQDYPSFIESAKERFELLLNPKTFWIHFDGDEEDLHYKIPTIENLSYLFLLIHSHHKECIQKAFERLQKLLHFYVERVGFPENLHDFPTVKSFNEQIFILLILKRLHEKYGKYFKLDLLEKLQFVITDLHQILEDKISNPVHQAKFVSFYHKFESTELFSTKDLGEALLISGLEANDLIFYHKKSQTVTRNKFIEKRVGHYEEITPYHLIAQFYLKTLDVKAIPNSQLRYLPLLDPKWLEMELKFNESCNAPLQIGSGFTLKYPHHYSIQFETLYSAIFQEEKNLIEICVDYPKEESDDKESLIETQLFFTKDSAFNLAIGDKKRTAFYLDETVFLTDNKGIQIAKIQFESQGGVFMGTFSFGNRSNQKKKSFTPYDQVIGIRTVKRGPHAKLKIKIDYSPSWDKDNSLLSIATPIACSPLST